MRPFRGVTRKKQPQEAKCWRWALSLVWLKGCIFFFFLLSANQFPSGHNYSQLHFIIVHLLSSFLSRRREIGQKHKELFLGFGLWKSRLVLFTQSLFRFTQPNHRHVTCQAQVNRGKQIVLINQWLLSNQRIPERYTR